MSYLQRKANYAYGVSVWLGKQSIGFVSRKKMNNIMIDFLKSKSLPYKKLNYNYKGLNTADLINSEYIQENWDEFKQWFLTNKYNYGNSNNLLG